jgi:hypothetical protein
MVWRIDAKGNVERWVDATDFPPKITNFNDLEIESAGNVYISDCGDWEGGGGAFVRITQEKQIAVVLTGVDEPRLVSPNGLLMEGADRLLVVDYTTGTLFRIDLRSLLPMAGGVPVQAASKTMEKVASGFGAADGLARDAGGRLIITDYTGHRVFVLAGPGPKPDEKPRENRGARHRIGEPVDPDMEAESWPRCPCPDSRGSPDPARLAVLNQCRVEVPEPRWGERFANFAPASRKESPA